VIVAEGLLGESPFTSFGSFLRFGDAKATVWSNYFATFLGVSIGSVR
jgi:heme exporter protein D